MSRVGFAPVPRPRAYSTKEGHPIPFLSAQLPWGRNQEPLLCFPGALLLGRDIRQYDVALWTMCNYVHQRPVLGTGESPWGISRAFLTFITLMSPASPSVGLKKEVGAPLKGEPLSHSPIPHGHSCFWLPVEPGGVWAGHPQSLPQPL